MTQDIGAVLLLSGGAMIAIMFIGFVILVICDTLKEVFRTKKWGVEEWMILAYVIAVIMMLIGLVLTAI